MNFSHLNTTSKTRNTENSILIPSVHALVASPRIIKQQNIYQEQIQMFKATTAHRIVAAPTSANVHFQIHIFFFVSFFIRICDRAFFLSFVSINYS